MSSNSRRSTLRYDATAKKNQSEQRNVAKAKEVMEIASRNVSVRFAILIGNSMCSTANRRVEDNMCVYVIFRCVYNIGRTVELKIIHIIHIFKLCVVEKTIAVAEYSIETKWCPPSP